MNASKHCSICTHVASRGADACLFSSGGSQAASTGSGGRRDLGRRPKAGSGWGRWLDYGWSCCPARTVDDALPPARSWPSLSLSGWCSCCRLLTGKAGRCTDRLDCQYKKWMHQSIVQYTSRCCPGCWRLAAFLGRFIGGFNRICWTLGLGEGGG